MTLLIGKNYVLDGRPVKCVASITRPTFVMEFQDQESVYGGVFQREVMAGQSNQFVVCESSPIVNDMKESV